MLTMLLRVHISFENCFHFGYVLEEMGHQGAFLVTRRKGNFTPSKYNNLLTPKLRDLLWTLMAELTIFLMA